MFKLQKKLLGRLGPAAAPPDHRPRIHDSRLGEAQSGTGGFREAARPRIGARRRKQRRGHPRSWSSSAVWPSSRVPSLRS